MLPAHRPSPNARRPRVALIIDAENWAFAQIARQLSRHLSHEFEFRVIPASVIDHIVPILLMTAGSDITHFFWRELLGSVLAQPAQEYARELGFGTHGHFLDSQVRPRRLTTSVYDHLLLDLPAIRSRRPLFNQLVCAYTVSSQRLLDIYQGLPGIPAPALLTEDGVDLDLFRPKGLDRLVTTGQRPLVVGWAGNSAWASHLGEDFKGLHTVLKPAIAQLQQEGMPIELKLADRQERHIPHTEMVDYYQQLDVYVCPSKTEGTPNPVLEATACGVPVISTRVGIVPELLGDDPYGMILPERSVSALKQALHRHYQGGASRAQQVSAYGLKRIRTWSWAEKARNYSRFFHHVLSHHHAH